MKSLRLTLALAATLLVAPAFAQEQAQPQANKPVQPSETKAFGDWTVRCYPTPSLAPCEMLELRVAKKTGQRILGLSIVYVPSRDAQILQISVPLGVALQSGLVIDTDTYKSQGPLKFRRCDQMGCYVEAQVGADVIDQIGRATKAQVTVISIDGKRYPLVFSLGGFADAHKSLVELAKAKATNAPPAAPQR